MDLHKHQLYLLEQHSGSFKIWSAIIRINTVYVIGHRLYKLYPNQSNPTHKKVKKKIRKNEKTKTKKLSTFYFVS